MAFSWIALMRALRCCRHEAVKLKVAGAILDLADPLPRRPEASEEEQRAHFACGEVKTRTQDLPRISKTKRQQARHDGTRKPPRGFKIAAGSVFDWTMRRYIRSVVGNSPASDASAMM
jgi:hypothetical protein